LDLVLKITKDYFVQIVNFYCSTSAISNCKTEAYFKASSKAFQVVSS